MKFSVILALVASASAAKTGCYADAAALTAAADDATGAANCTCDATCEACGLDSSAATETDPAVGTAT